MKNAMFQYATSKQIFINTDLITVDEALELLEENKSDFIQQLEDGEDPEIAIWINCKDNTDYHSTLHHWHSSEAEVINGRLYIAV